eukprot:GILK01004685.1.p1 GENE.GILK01004685.1~~GILK01004685.1.p1  ORF type:complete len:222 (-),score=15.99 GILK01004685.1:387-983(-)
MGDEFSSLQQTIERLGAVRTGKWMVTHQLQLHKFAASDPDGTQFARELHVIEFSDAAENCFLVVDKDPHKNVLEIHKAMLLVMDRIQLYEPRQKVRIEGFIYSFGDFAIKMGSYYLGASAKALVVEVEYKPGIRLADCNVLGREFLDQLTKGSTRQWTDADFVSYGLPARFSMQHSALQHVALFRSLQSTGSAGPTQT